MWVVTLLLLAVAAYFLLNAMRSKNEHDSQNQQSGVGEIDNSDSAQLPENASSSEAFQNAGGAPSGAATNDALASGASGAAIAGAGAATVSAAAAIASAREHNLKDLSGDAANDVREMLKILNLRDSDSARLSIDKAQFAGLQSGNSALSGDELSAVADKLRWMLR